MISLEAASLTDLGRERPINEDRAWLQMYTSTDGDPVGLFVVCDGVGGSQGGEVASHWAVEAVRRELSPLFTPPDPRATVLLERGEVEAAVLGTPITRLTPVQKLENYVRQAVLKANDVVYEITRQKPDAADAGTTITLTLVTGNRAIIGNVGDSRTYLLRDKRLRQITHDHSLVATLVSTGQIRPEEAFIHPQRNLIFRSLGSKKEVEVDTFMQILEGGDSLMLCSDGLWEMIQDEGVIAKILLDAPSPQVACEKLVEAANRAGGQDNISVIVVRVR